MPFRLPRLTPTVKKLLIANAALFVVFVVLEKVLGVPIFRLLALDVNYSAGPSIEHLWQPFTYWLVYLPAPSALMDVGLTMLGIYFFLCPFEEAYGGKRSLQLAAVGVLAAALPCMLAGFVLTQRLPVHGGSAILLAALGAFPVILKGRQILFMFLIPMKAWTIIAFGVGISALLALLASDPFIFIEHCGALFGGVAYARWMTRPRDKKGDPKGGPKKKKRRSGGPDLRMIEGGADDDKPRWLN